MTEFAAAFAELKMDARYDLVVSNPPYIPDGEPPPAPTPVCSPLSSLRPGRQVVSVHVWTDVAALWSALVPDSGI